MIVYNPVLFFKCANVDNQVNKVYSTLATRYEMHSYEDRRVGLLALTEILELISRPELGLSVISAGDVVGHIDVRLRNLIDMRISETKKNQNDEKETSQEEKEEKEEDGKGEGEDGEEEPGAFVKDDEYYDYEYDPNHYRDDYEER